jgi:hypothetical protein
VDEGVTRRFSRQENFERYRSFLFRSVTGLLSVL